MKLATAIGYGGDDWTSRAIATIQEIFETKAHVAFRLQRHRRERLIAGPGFALTTTASSRTASRTSRWDEAGAPSFSLRRCQTDDRRHTGRETDRRCRDPSGDPPERRASCQAERAFARRRRQRWGRSTVATRSPRCAIWRTAMASRCTWMVPALPTQWRRPVPARRSLAGGRVSISCVSVVSRTVWPSAKAS